MNSEYKENPKGSQIGSKWDAFFQEIGLPKFHDIDEDNLDLEPHTRFMPLQDFRKFFPIRGPVIGNSFYDPSRRWCLAGSSVLAWITGGISTDHDFFPVDIYAAEDFSRMMFNKGYELIGITGDYDVMEMTLGLEELELPDPTRVTEWYFGSSLGKNLPEALDPLATFEQTPDEHVRALNFGKAGSDKTRQCVLLIRGEPLEVIDTFDFSISQLAIDGDYVYWGKHTWQSIARKRVRINRIHHPLSTMRRMLKYANRGYFFCQGTMLEIAQALTYFADARIELGLNPFDQPFSID